MTYAVKEIFLTLQGEGTHAGRPAVFCRFTGCNLWSGQEADRARAICRFCDTDFVGTDGLGGGRFRDAHALADAILEAWGIDARSRFVVMTGGEPLLQIDAPLIDALHQRGFRIAVETNGSIPVPSDIDWVCVSPKAGAPLVQLSGDELKLAFPQEGLSPDSLSVLDFDNFRLQPIDGPDRERNTREAIAYCLHHRQWGLSLQTHKYVGLR